MSVSVGGVEVTEISFPPLAPGEQSARPVHYRIPDLPTGRHNTEFTVRIQGKTISKNNYPGTFFNRKALPLSKQNRRILLLPEKDSGLEKILDLLGLEYRISPEIPEHFSGVVVLTGRNSSGIREKIVGTAIQKGLRILLLELQVPPDLLPGRLIAPLYPDTTELVLPSHPVFRNLSDDDFRMWNSTSERFSDRTLLSLGFYPFHEGALLMKQAQNSRRLMAAGEFQAFGGMRIVAGDGRIISAEAGGCPIDDDRTYGLATITFLLHGGDDLYLGEGVEEVTEYPVDIYDMMMDYILSETAAGRDIRYHTDGRIEIR